ncbi:DNA helicase HerA-like ATPase [Halarchaeum solikamskense]|uniref:ATP-binding protein n=1 Tax=Halosegnis longus TaxID=2216012 RepID=A0AAJ4UUW1_9EURY|nr:type IV secretory system conjugative DNA transfer family protein [Halarchaeum solikamskense]MBP2252554.1 DNA helicase HerA-like ATPase [Halarchaeum solikamskense]RNJ22683.1 ATP-binding protein [Salella cibi]
MTEQTPSELPAVANGDEYIRITPSRSDLAPETVVRQLAGLHGLGAGNDGLLASIGPFGDPPPVFEFLAVSEGADEPVEFYYGADRRLDAFEERLRTLYPPTVTFERVTLDLEAKLLPSTADPSQDHSAGGDDSHGMNPGTAEESSGDPNSDSKPVTLFDSTGQEPVGDGGSVLSESNTSQDEDEVLFEADSNDESTAAGPSDSELDADHQPAHTDPTVDETIPLGITWHGQATRREDWMTTLPQFTNTEDDDDDHARAPLASLIDQLTRAEHPIAFQVLFQRKSDWTHEARERQRKLREGEDRVVDWFFGELLGNTENEPQSPSNTGRQRRYLDIGGRERVEAIDEKEPQHTFTVNMRALSLVTSDRQRERVDHRLDDIGSVFDHLNGPHYRLRPKRIRRGLRKGRRAKKHADRVLNATLATKSDWRKTRPDLVLGPAELANFVVVPPATDLTTEGGRGSDAEPESRTPLPLPAQDHMDAFTDSGMAIGRGLGEDGTPTPEPMRIPPHLLPFHVGRFAKSGAGKSVALINDALSLYDQTTGPVFLIDSKGGNLPENYMRAHGKRFGTEDLEENVLHFSVPDILPGFAFFDITPALEDGVRRVDAIQDKADHYEELIKLVMGPERYEDAIASPTLIKYLIKAMYDEEYGLENGHFRQDTNYFTHDQFEQAVTQFHAAGPPDSTPEDAPRASDPQVAGKLERHLRSNPATFSNVVSGISNRMDYITQDAHLRRIFNNTQSQFDFRDLLDEDKVVIFDLGDLRDEAARVMTGVILTQLYDAVKRRDGDELARKPDDYVANLLIDEASSVVVSDTLTTLLEKGREFRLSIELVTQFPEQMKEAGNREVYLNVLNNIGSPLVGKIAVDADIAEALSHEAMDPVEFKNRISSLPRGEWIAQLPSPEFGETGPDPFSIEPLPIPPGHPDSEQPLTGAQEERFQDALEAVHEHTREEYGVAGGTTVESRDAATDVALENADDLPLEVAMARAIRAVQLSNDVRETNGWVSVEDVDEELLSRIEEDTIEAQGYETLPEVREASSLIEVDLQDGGSSVQCRLTDEGEEAATPDTSTSPTGGGEHHDAVLETVERALAAAGFSVEVLDQNGESRPDAIATHADLDRELQVEVETTTHVRPAKVLSNLRKAQEQERIPLFVVADHDDQTAAEIADRLAKILDEPRNQLSSGETRLYTMNHNVKFNGGARAADGVTAVRPAIGGSRHTRWFERDGVFVLEDSAGDQHARIDSFDAVSKDQFPATYSYDAESESYTVFRPGELPESYESREAFEADWVPVKRPFLPSTDLPVPEYTDDSYAIGVIGDEQNLELYTPDSDATKDLAALTEAIKNNELHLAGVEPDEPADEQSMTQEDHENDPFGIQAFVRDRLTESDDGVVAVADVYDAYEQYAAAGEYEVKPKNRFTRTLRDHTQFERDKKWLDGQTRRCYVGIELADAGDQEESSDASA